MHLSSRTYPCCVMAALRSSPTTYPFRLGLAESDVYRADAEAGMTRGVIEPLTNVAVLSHPGGHEFPLDAVCGFAQAHLLH